MHTNWRIHTHVNSVCWFVFFLFFLNGCLQPVHVLGKHFGTIYPHVVKSYDPNLLSLTKNQCLSTSFWSPHIVHNPPKLGIDVRCIGFTRWSQRAAAGREVNSSDPFRLHPWNGIQIMHIREVVSKKYSPRGNFIKVWNTRGWKPSVFWIFF